MIDLVGCTQTMLEKVEWIMSNRKKLTKLVLCGLLAANIMGISSVNYANYIANVTVNGVTESVEQDTGTFTIGKDGAVVSISSVGYNDAVDLYNVNDHMRVYNRLCKLLNPQFYISTQRPKK